MSPDRDYDVVAYEQGVRDGRHESAAEIDRLLVENIQMRFALGYPMPADLERHVLPNNPFKCGTCDARRRQALDQLFEADAALLEEKR